VLGEGAVLVEVFQRLAQVVAHHGASSRARAGATMLGLRVATRLAELVIDLDRTTEASDLIGPVLDVVVLEQLERIHQECAAKRPHPR
jgi:hypothetical protein